MVKQTYKSVYLLLCLAVVCANDIKQLYFSAQHTISFRPTANDSIVGQSTSVDENDCPLRCLTLVACQLAMYSSTNHSCTLYNSIDGILTSRDGYVTYIPSDTLNAVGSTVETTTKQQVVTGTAPTCVTGTFPLFNTNLIALWPFDNSAVDAQGIHNGTLMGEASFSTKGYMNASLRLAPGSSSYVETSNVGLVSTSFTIELWIYLDNIPDTSMVLVSQNTLTLRVDSGGIIGVSQTPSAEGTYLRANRWYHIALVYYDSLAKQEIYVNGKLDSVSDAALVFNATSAFFIGTLDGTSEFFSGQIDHLSITARIKSPCELLRDASLLASYSFTNGQVNIDSGPYGMYGRAVGSAYNAPGRVGDGFSVSDDNTYFQTSGMTGLMTAEGEYSFTLFISPSSTRACVLIYVSGTSDISDASTARPYLGIDSSGNLIGEIPRNYTFQTSMNIPIKQWSHVALTYSYPKNNVSFYYNGLLHTSAPGPGSNYGPTVTVPPVFITVANPLEGQNGTIIQAQSFRGIIDELTIWSRELNATEIYEAAHPN